MKNINGPIDPFESREHSCSDCVKFEDITRLSQSLHLNSSTAELLNEQDVFATHDDTMTNRTFHTNNTKTKMLQSNKRKSTLKPKLQFAKSISNFSISGNQQDSSSSSPDVAATNPKKSRTLSRIFLPKNNNHHHHPLFQTKDEVNKENFKNHHHHHQLKSNDNSIIPTTTDFKQVEGVVYFPPQMEDDCPTSPHSDSDVYDMEPIITEEEQQQEQQQQFIPERGDKLSGPSPTSTIEFWNSMDNETAKINNNTNNNNNNNHKNESNFSGKDINLNGGGSFSSNHNNHKNINLEKDENESNWTQFSSDQNLKTTSILQELATMNEAIQSSNDPLEKNTTKQQNNKNQMNTRRKIQHNRMPSIERNWNQLSPIRPPQLNGNTFKKFSHLNGGNNSHVVLDRDDYGMMDFEEENLETFSIDTEREQYDMTPIVKGISNQIRSLRVKDNNNTFKKDIASSESSSLHDKDSNNQLHILNDLRDCQMKNDAENASNISLNQSVWGENFNSFIHSAMGIESNLDSSDTMTTSSTKLRMDSPQSKLKHNDIKQRLRESIIRRKESSSKLDTSDNIQKNGHPFDSDESDAGSEVRNFVTSLSLQLTPKSNNRKRSLELNKTNAFGSIRDVKQYLETSKSSHEDAFHDHEDDSLLAILDDESDSGWPPFHYNAPMTE